MYNIVKFSEDETLYDKFMEFGDKLYNDDKFYRSKEINSTQSGTTFFMVSDNENILCRAAAIINPNLKYENYVVGLIGLFESYDDQKAVDLLFSSINGYFKSLNINYVIGPMNGSTWSSYRTTLEDSMDPFFLDNYNKPYYSRFFLNSGFKTISAYYSSRCNSLNPNLERINKFSKYFEKKGFVFRNINLDDLENDLNKIYQVTIDSFKNNFLYTDIPFSDFKELYFPIKKIVNPEFVILCENENKDPISFIFGIEDHYAEPDKSLIIKTLATRSDYQFRGLGSYIIELFYQRAKRHGYREVIHALMQESNSSLNILADSHVRFREYELYGKEIC